MKDFIQHLQETKEQLDEGKKLENGSPELHKQFGEVVWDTTKMLMGYYQSGLFTDKKLNKQIKQLDKLMDDIRRHNKTLY